VSEDDHAEEGLDLLLAGLGHDLRSPLNVIIGFSDLLLLGLPGPLTEAQRHQVTEIRTAGHAMLRLTDGLVELARIERGDVAVEPESMPIGPLLDDIRSSFQAEADERGLTLDVERSGPDRCQTDGKVLGRLLGQLVANGLASTGTGGVTIRAGNGDAEGAVRIEVVDTGPGISEHDRRMLFHPFDRGASDDPRPGTGLVLFLARRLADLLGAEITLETELGRGSSFAVVLPGRP
jgi:signal transduction histidine kinase